MNITITVDVNVTFYHKKTMEKIVIDKIIKEKYNEDSEEYLSFCRAHESEVGFGREENKEKFDKAISELLCQRLEEEWSDRLSKITDAVRTSFLDSFDHVTGCVELCGCILNPKDFCAMSVNRFNIRASKG